MNTDSAVTPPIVYDMNKLIEQIEHENDVG